MTPHTIVFVGPPGSGKGTQAGILSEQIGWPHLDVGEMLREQARGHDELSQQIKETMAQGRMLPSKLVSAVVRQRLQGSGPKRGVILDGFARRREQVTNLLEWAEAKEIPPLISVFLDVPPEDLIERIKLRRYCTDCNHKTYLVTDAQAATQCLRCGGHLARRSDDAAETVAERLRVYRRTTVPAIAQLRKASTVLDIDGRGSIEEVAHQIRLTLQQHE